MPEFSCTFTTDHEVDEFRKIAEFKINDPQARRIMAALLFDAGYAVSVRTEDHWPCKSDNYVVVYEQSIA